MNEHRILEEDTDNNLDLATNNKPFVEIEKRIEDVKSTAFAFLIVGFCGLLFLSLLLFNVILITMEFYMKTLLFSVLFLVFVSFVLVGLFSFRQLQKLKLTQIIEQREEKELKDRFLSAYEKNISIELDVTTEKEQLYFSRTKQMQIILQSLSPNLTEDYQDYLIDQLYGELYPED